MPRLILLNGAPGSGKSTLARRFVDEHPLTLALEIDDVRAMLGRWLDDPIQAGLLARQMAGAMAWTHLHGGRDVIVPQYLGRLDFVLTLEQLCTEIGAEFIEVALVSNPADAARRFTHRSNSSDSPAHRDADQLQRRSGGVEELVSMYHRLLDVVKSRAATRTVTTVDGDPEQAYTDLLTALSRSPTSSQ